MIESPELCNSIRRHKTCIRLPYITPYTVRKARVLDFPTLLHILFVRLVLSNANLNLNVDIDEYDPHVYISRFHIKTIDKLYVNVDCKDVKMKLFCHCFQMVDLGLKTC